MTIKDLKKHLTFWEERGTINDDTEVIIGKLGYDVNPVQAVCDTDIQVVREGMGAWTTKRHSMAAIAAAAKVPNDRIAFTIITE